MPGQRRSKAIVALSGISWRDFVGNLVHLLPPIFYLTAFQKVNPRSPHASCIGMTVKDEG
jgi:hypothetical protein